MSNDLGETSCIYKGAIIFLHGSGDTGPGVQAWLDYVSCGDFERKLSMHNIICTFPTAPLQKHTLSGGELRHVWYDRASLSLDSTPDEEGSLFSMETVEAAICELEAEGIPRSNLVIGGFSMGGGLMLHSVVKGWCQHFAGVFSLSNFLYSCYHMADHSHSSGTPPLYLAHGLSDDMIPAEWGSATAEALHNGGYNIQYTEYIGLGHDMSRAELMELVDWILSILCGNCIEHIPSDAESTSEVIDSELQHDQPEFCVTYAIDVSDGENCTVRFTVPPEFRDEIVKQPLVAKGSFFQLHSCEIDEHIVITTFSSPYPEDTADTLAQKIENRLRDGPPPGVEA